MLRRLSITLLLVLALGFSTLILLGSKLVAPQPRDVGPPPADLAAEAVKIPKANGDMVAGWFVAGPATRPGVLLLHGVRSDRRAMLARSRFLRKAGYSVLMIDMQAHGETPGERITFGFDEARDVHAAVGFLRQRLQHGKVGVIGVSMGGAAALLGDSPVPADAVILEAVYSSIEQAVADRMALRLGVAGAYLAPLLTWQIRPRLGVSPQALSPLQAIGRLQAPVMVIAGTEDRRTPVPETHRLFAAAEPPKQLWLVDGAAHENLHRFAGARYEQRVLQFFRRHLDGLAD